MYVLLCGFCYLLLIEFAIIIVIFFKHVPRYIENHKAINKLAMLFQLLNNLFYFYPGLKELSFKGVCALVESDKGIQQELWILFVFFLQVNLGAFLTKRLKNGGLGNKAVVLKLMHRINGVIMYLLTKFRFWDVFRENYFDSEKAVYYSAFLMYSVALLSVYIYFYFVFWRVKNFNFDGPYLVNSLQNNAYLREVLVNIENGDFEIPKQSAQIELKSREASGEGNRNEMNLFKKKEAETTDRDNFFNESINGASAKKRPTEVVGQGELCEDKAAQLKAVQLKSRMKSANPSEMCWTMIENKIFDVSSLNHPRGLFLYRHIRFADITLQIFRLKSLKYESAQSVNVRKLRGDEISRGYYLLEDKCLGFIDTNQGLIFNDTPDLKHFMLLRAKSKKSQNLLRNRAFRSNMKRSRRPSSDPQRFCISSQRTQESQLNSSALTGMSVFSRHSASSRVVAKEGNLLEFLDREMKLTKYVHNWRVVDTQSIGSSLSIQYIKNIKENFFLNLKNYWFKNLGKYYLAKWSTRKQYFYVCNALHPKYLARKYLSLASSDLGILNYLFARMGRPEQALVSNYLGFNFSEIKSEFTASLLTRDDPGKDGTLKLFWERMNEHKHSICMKSHASSDLSHEHFQIEAAQRGPQQTRGSGGGQFGFRAADELTGQLETIAEEKYPPKNRYLGLLLRASPDDSRFAFESQPRFDVSEHSPDHCSNLGTPFSHLVPLIKSPLNGGGLPDSQLVQLVSNLGLGINMQNFSDQSVFFVVKDFGILPIIDFLEMVLQIRIKHLKKIISVCEGSAGSDLNISCFKISEEKCQGIKDLISRQLSGTRANLDFSALSLECFDDEYLLSFANLPQFSLYWEISRSFKEKNLSGLLSRGKGRKRDDAAQLGALLGLRIIDEFQVVDSLIRDLLVDLVEQSSTQNGINQHLAECDQFTESLKSQRHLHSQWSDLSRSTKFRNQGNHFISNPNVERIGRNSMLRNVLICSESGLDGTIQSVPDSNVRVECKRLGSFQEIKTATFGVDGLELFEKVCFSGCDAWVNRVIKGVDLESVNVNVL